MNSIVDWIFEKLSDDEKAELIRKVECKGGEVKLSDIKNGDIFKIGDIEFIKFSDEDGITTAITKDIVFISEFGKNNNFAESEVLRKMKDEFLPKIISIVGVENIGNISTDLTTLDGVKTYGGIESYISIPTFDFYRANTAIFDKYKLDEWWWLATPWSAKPHYDSSCIVCVSPSGDLNTTMATTAITGCARFYASYLLSLYQE